MLTSLKSRKLFISVVMIFASTMAFAQGELRFCLRSEPKTFNPLLVQDDASEAIRYLTGGVLIRFNRQTQQVEPALAESWKISDAGRTITFELRNKVYFSDGTPFTADDVAYTIQQLMDPNLHSATGDAFRSGAGEVKTKIVTSNRISITFPAALAGLDRLFDQVAMMSKNSPKKEMAVLGPFFVADHKSGAYILLRKNPNYWKKGTNNHPLPLLDSVRIDIQPNRDIEALRFRRGEIDLINDLTSDYFDKLASDGARDSGPSLDSEQMWFNQVPNAPIDDYKKEWFRSANFRRAISESINRNDLCRVAFLNHAQPAIGPVSPTNHFWFNSKLKPMPLNPTAALKLLQQDGFRLEGSILKDRTGHEVEFSIVTNSGNKPRERMAAMIQEDLKKIGIKVNVVTLDFPSLVERITGKFNYEGALLGLNNVEVDPNGVMNVWLSSGENHQWNPGQTSPASAWESEIDELMREQASASDVKVRKAAWDRVQEIAYDQQPFIYLVNKNALSAIASSVNGAAPVALNPKAFWNIDSLSLRGRPSESGR